MKKHFYFCFTKLVFLYFVILSCITISAQNNIGLDYHFDVDNSHPRYPNEYDFISQIQKNYIRHSSVKNAAANFILSSNYQSWNNNTWVDTQKDLYSYNEYGSKTTMLSQIIQDVGLVNGYMWKYIYDSNQLLTEHIAMMWERGEWNGYYKLTYIYDDEGKLLEDYYHRINASGDDWEISRKNEYYYDEEDRDTLIVGKRLINRKWIEYYRTIKLYENKNLISELQLVFQENSNEWVNNILTTTSYDSENYMVEQISKNWQNETWNNQSKVICIYNDDYKHSEEITFYGDGDSWVENMKTTVDWNDSMSEKVILIQLSIVDGWENISRVFSLYSEIPVGVDELDLIPGNYFLTNYPNPFNPSTNIRFQIPKGQNINLAVYNSLGQKICNLLDTYLQPGTHEVKWNGRDEYNKYVSSGIYFYVLKSGSTVISNKMVLNK